MKLSILLSFLALLASASRVIEFNSRNLITIRGPIQGSSATSWINQMNDRDPDADTMYIYLTSPGGSVLEGNKIIDQIKTLETNNVNVVCVADFAASMAFVILQSCPSRTALSSSVLMQHQMSLGLQGSLESVNSYLDFIHQININLEAMQANRVNMTVDAFKQKVMNDWWIPGHNAKDMNIVDEIVMVKCSKEILAKRDKLQVRTIFGTVEVIYSKCPIARAPLEVKFVDQNKNVSQEDLYTEIKDYIPDIYMSKYYSNKKLINY